MIEFEFGRATYQGERDYQEDECEFAILKPSSLGQIAPNNSEAAASLLAVLSDGMGGHAGGAVASKTAINAFIGRFRSGSDSKNAGDRHRTRLQEALRDSNLALSKATSNNPDLQGMGCTVVGVRFNQRGMLWISVGDSPLYRYRNGKVEQVNEDHSLVPMLEGMVERGEMTPEAAENHPQRNALRSAVTGTKIELVDSGKEFLKLRPGDWIILASDGLQSLSENTIANIVRETKNGGAQVVADQLLNAVRQKAVPYQDNTTLMVIVPYKIDEKTGKRLPAPAEKTPVLPPLGNLMPSGNVLIGGGIAGLTLVAGLLGYALWPAADGPKKADEAGTKITDPVATKKSGDKAKDGKTKQVESGDKPKDKMSGNSSANKNSSDPKPKSDKKTTNDDKNSVQNPENASSQPKNAEQKKDSNKSTKPPKKPNKDKNKK